MKNILRNFWVTLTRFKMASALNILGLAIAFAVFTIIMIQSYWEFSYNKSFKDYPQIVRLENGYMGVKGRLGYNAPRPMGDMLGEKVTTVEHFGIYWPHGERKVLTTDQSNSQASNLIDMSYISQGFLNTFSIECLEGSLDDFVRPGAKIITKSAAQKLFGNESAVGKQIIIGDTSAVIAVIADFPENTSFRNGIYANIGEIGKGNRENWNYEYYFKASSPDKLNDMHAEFTTLLIDYFGEERPAETIGENIVLRPVADMYFTSKGGNYTLTYTLICIAILIIFIAVINFINFFMALVPIRIRAVNINKIFGTPVTALRVNIICETLGIVLVAFGLSLLILQLAAESWLSEYVVTSLKIENNLSAVLITGALALAVGLVAGLYPSWYITKFSPMMVLRGSFGRSKSGQRVRVTLITVQYAISVALIIGAIFIQMQTKFMLDKDMGFNRDRLITVSVEGRIASQPQAFLDILKQNPNILGVSYSANDIVNIRMGWGRTFSGEEIYFDCLPVSWDYPEFMGIELVEGRLFTQDDASKTNGTMIINQTMARNYNMKVGDFIVGHANENPAEVVGIVKDFNFTSVKNSIDPVCLYEFGSAGWYVPNTANIRISPSADYAEVAATISSAIKKLVPTAIDDEIVIKPFDQTVEALYAREQKLSSIITLFSMVAIIIALAGVFGLVVFEVQYRKKEIALRKVMGASVASIPPLVGRRFVRVTIISSLIAIPLGYYAVWQWIQEFPVRIPMMWWVALLAFAIVLTITILIVVSLTLKTATENPIKAIKTE